MQKLSKRLKAAAAFVSKGSRVADIGTDHGFLPIYLIQSGRCRQAIAMDIRKGPLMRAQEHIAAAGLEAVIQTRLSDGMQELQVGEADSIVIAGMGGLTVLHILEGAKHLQKDVKELILEPQSDIAKVRKYVREHKMYIDKEDLVYESGKFYPVLHVMPRQLQTEEAWENRGQRIRQILLEKLADQERICSLFDQYGECVIADKHPVLAKRLAWEKQREYKILCELEKGRQAACGQQDAGVLLKRKEEVLMRLEEIELLQELYHGIR